MASPICLKQTHVPPQCPGKEKSCRGAEKREAGPGSCSIWLQKRNEPDSLLDPLLPGPLQETSLPRGPSPEPSFVVPFLEGRYLRAVPFLGVCCFQLLVVPVVAPCLLAPARWELCVSDFQTCLQLPEHGKHPSLRQVLFLLLRMLVPPYVIRL